MPDPIADVQLTKQAIQTLIDQLVITQIVYVDDFFELRYDVEVVIGWLNELPPQKYVEAEVLFPGVSFNSPSEVWKQAVGNFWRGLSLEQQKTTMLGISTLLGTSFSKDLFVVNRLSDCFPDTVPPQKLTPSDWTQQRDRILQTGTSTSKILCLFDQDLSEARNFPAAGPNGGMGLLKDVIERNLEGVVICCLLTHTIPSIENEINAWRLLADENGLELFQFMPLAKSRLTDSESPLCFADGIKKAMLNLYCEKWKTEAIKIIDISTQKAVEEVKNVDVYDFDHMIFLKSLNEGVGEIDTFVRLFQIFHRDEIRKLILDPKKSIGFRTLIDESRPIAAVQTNNTHTFPQIRPIRRKELYESPDFVNHTPIEVGDLFQNLSDQTTYILLGQPCDLMVRNDGTRSSKGLSDNLMVPLIPLERKSIKKFDKSSNNMRTHDALYYYYPDSNDIAEISFAATIRERVMVLDLAVLDNNGICNLDFKKIPPIPSNCTPGWRIHLESLIDYYRTEYEQYMKLIRHVHRIKHETKIIIEQKCDLMNSYSKNSVNFGWQRIGRYRQIGASRMLKAYTNYLSRDAEEVDFAK